MKKGVLEEGEDTLGGYLAGLVAPGGHQQRGGRGERSRETAHLPTLKNRIKYSAMPLLCPGLLFSEILRPGPGLDLDLDQRLQYSFKILKIPWV